MGRVRAVTLIALIAGAVGTTGFFLRAGQRTPRLLLILMAIWVLAPFAVLLWAYAASLQWAPITRATLYLVMWVVALGSLAVYGDDAGAPQAAGGLRLCHRAAGVRGADGRVARARGPGLRPALTSTRRGVTNGGAWGNADAEPVRPRGGTRPSRDTARRLRREWPQTPRRSSPRDARTRCGRCNRSSVCRPGTSTTARRAERVQRVVGEAALADVGAMRPFTVVGADAREGHRRRPGVRPVDRAVGVLLAERRAQDRRRCRSRLSGRKFLAQLPQWKNTHLSGSSP